MRATSLCTATTRYQLRERWRRLLQRAPDIGSAGSAKVRKNANEIVVA